MRIVGILGLCLLSSACVTEAAEVAHVMTCARTDSGAPVLSLGFDEDRDLVEARYLEGNDPRVLKIEEAYNGGIVKALRARYSPALTTRLEISREYVSAFDPVDPTFRGAWWPIASSQAFAVTCTEANG